MAKKRHSKRAKRNSRRPRRNGPRRRLRRNPDTITWIAIAGAGYLGYRWWKNRQATTAMAPSAPAPTVVQPTPPPAVSGLGSLIVM
jgi:hypothetical protein